VTGPIGPLSSPGFWLQRAAQFYLRELDARLRPLELTHTQFQLLAAAGWLGRDGPGPTQQQVAEFAGADRMMTSKVLATLEARGLLVRTADAQDARLRRVTITEPARDLLREATRVARAVDAALLGGDAELRDRLAAIAEGSSG
jgi:DNA-binding MarR family transcriptional regulator